jgi:SAM-dependent methyltransferase
VKIKRARKEKAMSIQKSLDLKLPLFVDDLPADANAFRLRAGSWKFKFDEMSSTEIDEFLRTVDGRPRLCSEIFPNFKQFKIIEFGPSDGYNTAQLELCGARSVLAIEGNADAFLRCLILKNALGLNAKFLLGDFNKYIANPDLNFDLAYASGVIYHLPDPINFILNCARFAKNIFIWSLYYDQAAVEQDPYEIRRFVAHEPRSFSGVDFVYHRRAVDPAMLDKPTYQGGIEELASWLTLADLRVALQLAGYTIVREIPDHVNKMPAMNIWAIRK